MRFKYKEKLVSVIVPVYKREKYIGKCIKTILSQTYKPLELIIVYDPSPDRTFEIIREYKRSYPDKITLIVQKRKTSAARARNIGILYSRGEFIAFCDSDDIWHQDKVRRQINFLRKNKDIGLTYTDIIFINEDDQILGRFSAPEWDKNKWLINRFIAFSSVVLRRSLIDEVGLFDENLIFSEDFDFLIRLSKITEFGKTTGFLTYIREHAERRHKNYPKILKSNVKILVRNRYYKEAFLEVTRKIWQPILIRHRGRL